MGQTDHFPEWTIYSDVCWLVGLVGVFSCFGVFFFCTKLRCLAAVIEDRWESGLFAQVLNVLHTFLFACSAVVKFRLDAG